MLQGCSKHETFFDKDFVGKWKSSRVSTPIYLYENGEWEFLSNEDNVMQYGVWQLTGNKIMWSVKVGDQMTHDLNDILSMTPREFKIRETDRSITTFSKLD